MQYQRLLAGDIGGTSTRLLLVQRTRGTTQVLGMQHYASRRYAGLAAAVTDFLSGDRSGPVAAACFAVAGPVRHEAAGESVHVTNLPWELTSAELARALDIPRVRLINDFEAIGYGIGKLNQDDVVTLQAGQPEAGAPRVVLGAGTGLGQAVLIRHGNHDVVIPTEGGHVDFGPTDSLQIELARWLMQHRGRATYEGILSGNGLVRVYEFLHERGTIPETPATAAAMKTGDPAEVISAAALAQHDPLAVAALDLFVKIYGAQAGNLALANGALGGVYVAGGIAPRILEKLKDGTFLGAFRAKGRMTALLERTPLHVIVRTDVGLQGALVCAEQLLEMDTEAGHDQGC